MNGDKNHVRLLPRTGTHGRPGLLITDGDGTVSRLADRIEEVQLGLGERLLGRTRGRMATHRPGNAEIRLLTGQLADALADALLIARSRGARLGGTGRDPADQTPPAPRAYGLLTLPGRDLASAGTARRYVRATAGSWGLLPGATDDLEAITGELAANALEHSGSPTVTVTCALTADTVTIGVTDDGRSGRTPVLPAPTGPADSDCERGRGLLITDALATRWGTRRTSGGLTVWAEVSVGAAPGAPAGPG
ncbi:ATP-binding protein [Streptomyces sp. NPDC056296]|uniref:ATP-binding protein n=1 Tax=Streptomyces sp. NPDC056296 TaxID=3345775 RepID=UPI0035DDD7C5